MINIGEQIKIIRNKKGITVRQLEVLSGVSNATISRIENDNQSPSIETLERICTALEISLKDFLEYNDKLPIDLLNLTSTIKKLSPEQRLAVNEMLKSFL